MCAISSHSLLSDVEQSPGRGLRTVENGHQNSSGGAGRTGLTAAELDRIKDGLRASVAPNTRRAYGRAIRCFLEAMDGCQFNDATVAAYVASMMGDGYAPASIRLAAGAIGAWARAEGMDDPRGPVTRQTLCGAVRRNRSIGRGKVDGFRRNDLEVAARLAASEKTTAGFRDAAMLRVGSDGLLRVSELAAVMVEDVTSESDGSGRLQIRASKTDQEGRGEPVYLGKPTMWSVSTWLRAARRKWTGAGEFDQGPLFRRVTRSGAVTGTAPLSPDAVRAVICKRAEAAGIEGRISGHSLRVGTAQDLVRAGADLPALMQAGRWSDAATAAGYASGELTGRGAVARFLYGVAK